MVLNIFNELNLYIVIKHEIISNPFESSAMYSFLLNCRDLVTEDVIRRMLAPLECALVMMSQ